MKRFLLIAVVFFLAAIFVVSYVRFVSSTTTETPANIYSLVKKDCGFSLPWQATVTCGELRTPKNSGEFFISFAILHDDSPQHRPDPVVYLQGGPGAGARIHKDGIEAWLAWQDYADLGRDIILIDTRGTGRSRPSVNCEAYSAFNRSLMRKNISLHEELARGYDVVSNCFLQLKNSAKPVSHTVISTKKNAVDIRALMALLEYPQWNILSVSYGTRLALEIARQEATNPQTARLKSMVLDSVYPAGYGGVQTWPQVLDTAMQGFFTGCENSPACGYKQQPTISLSERFIKVLNQLQQHPMELTVVRWDGEAPITFLVNDHRFLSASFAAIYDPEDWPKILTALTAVEQGKTEGLKPLIEPYLNNAFNGDFNSLTFMAVDCADNTIRLQQEYADMVAQFPLLAEYTRDQWRYQTCHALYGAAPHDNSLRLVPSDLPSLLLAGRLDPITPVQWAEELHALMPHSQLMIRDHLAHSVLSSDSCLLGNLQHFFDKPTEKFSACDKTGKKLVQQNTNGK